MSAELGLGTAALGRPEYLNLGHGDDLAADAGPERYDVQRLRSHAVAVLDAAWEAGVRHYDAARSYGAAEEFLGGWLAAAPARRREVRVGSKWGYTYVAGFSPGAAEHETKDHSVATLERQWPETLAALGGPPDLYLVHSLTSDSPALGDEAVLRRLRALADEGVRVGLSTSGPDQADVLRRALALPDPPFTTVQSTWNPLEPSAGPALARAHDAGWLVVVKEAMANGRLAGPQSVLATAAHELSSTPDAVALAVAAAQPWADVVLAGASTTAQLHANLAARDLVVPAGGWEGHAEPAAAYWEHRRSLPWT
ncbi:aldo/keto reductase [Nocardioides aurantiacus]|uniref:Aryl-alcohol dehydrogenase-like predicted oxidoreductase n=1 Tax=Nocardioides aurantiacus TaxID=86796 RepID=A0A3N2CPY0_9ACTN|nr:aldo/keto reductase [Nocardioides aurantiacus]ROR89476.1 aryl-alcohol dehydrogenase-like predicted oxidoreductase [Nocardioides aurantiacus]